MSKKQLNSRLNDLFAALDEAGGAPAPENVSPPPGWTWECNTAGNYISCSPEVSTVLGLAPEDFLGQHLRTFGLVSKSIAALEGALNSGILPAEANLYFQSRQGVLIPIRMHVFARTDDRGEPAGLRGFTQVLPSSTLLTESKPEQTARKEPMPRSNATLGALPGISLGPNGFESPSGIWSSVGSRSLNEQTMAQKPAHNGDGAALAIPLKLPGNSQGLMEILDETHGRKWSEDDRLLVKEVAEQLALALENAQLYNTVQQELSERVRAEQEIRSRNRDLSILNQIGQQLNRLASPTEILDQVFSAIGQVMDNSNLFIALFDELTQTVTFPVYAVDGQPQILSSQPYGKGLIEYIIENKAPLLISSRVPQEFKERGIESFGRSPVSLLAAPMMVGEKAIGVVATQDFKQENAFNNVQLELLSTIASQASIAIENARLFQQMQSALVTIEVRERYQKNVALAVATLSEMGTQSLADVLKTLGDAAQTSRAYFMQAREDERGAYWKINSEWCSDGSPSLLNNEVMHRLSPGQYAFLAEELKSQGRFSGLAQIMPGAERELMQSLGIRSFLAVEVPGKSSLPSFIGFDEINYDRPWGTEEIDALQMAAASLSNTIVREDLLDQLQVSLDETANLYNASRRLAVANGMQEMLAAITEGLQSPAISRAAILLFEDDGQGGFESMTVGANWSSGWGVPPLEIGTLFTPDAVQGLPMLASSTPTFFEDIRNDPRVSLAQQAVINPEQTVAGAIIPMWVGKRQLGVLLLQSDVRHIFNERETRSYPPLVGQMAIAIENLNLFEQTQLALSETETLYQASAELNVAKTYQEALNALKSNTVLGQQANTITINLFDQPTVDGVLPNSLRVVARFSEMDPSRLPGFYLMKNFPGAMNFLKHDRPTIVEDLETAEGLEENARALFVTQFHAKSTIFIPLVVGGQWIGFINAFYAEKTNLPESEVRRMMGLAGQMAVAVQNLHNISVTEQRADEAMHLFQTSQSLTQAQSEDEIYRIILEACDSGSDTDLQTIYLFGQDDEAYLEQVAHRADENVVVAPDGSRYLATAFPFTETMLQGATITVNNVSADSRLTEEDRQFLQSMTVNAALFIPLNVRGRNIGVLFAGRQGSGTFQASEVTYLQTLSTQLNVALDNYRLLHEAQTSAAEASKRSQELALINRVVSQVSASLDLRGGLQIVLDELIEAFQLASGAIALLNDDKVSMTVVADKTTTGQSAIGVRLVIADNPTTQIVVNTRKPYLVEDARNNPLTANLHDLFIKRQTDALIIVPLTAGSEVIGTVGMDIPVGGRVPSPDDIRLAETIVYQAATAIQNARLFEQIQQALSETELLYRISRSVSEATAPEQLLDLVVETVMPKQADRASLMTVSYNGQGEASQIEIQCLRDVGDKSQSIGIHLPFDAMPIASEIENTAVFFSNIASGELDLASRRTLEQLDVTSVCLLPLRSSGKLIGMLAVSARQVAEFMPQEIRLLQITADGISVALEKQRLLMQAQRRALELQTAAEIARDTSSTLALDALLQRTVTMLSDRFGFYHAAIYLLDDSRRTAIIREGTGKAGQEMKQIEYKIPVDQNSIIGKAIEDIQTLVVNDVTTSSLYRLNPRLPNTRSELTIPLRIGQRCIGALDVHSTQVNDFSMDDVNVLQTLSDQIAVAIDNARSYELSQKAIEEMREVDRVKSQFLANMSHELRTPLNSIIGFSRVILKGIDGPINDVQQTDLNAIYNSGQHLLRLINDILDLSKIEAGKMQLSVDDLNLADLINSVMSTATGLTKDKDVKLLKIIPEDLPTVRADTTRVRQVLLNFLSNAAKFTDEGSIVVETKVITSGKHQREVMITVTDSGPGIAEADQSKLFQPFSQVDDSPTRKTGGTGLGLSICRSLIDMHGGRIGLLRSEVGVGSTFFFTLPIKDAPSTLSSFPEVISNTNGPLILCIDDDPKVIGLYERYLSSQGYRVVSLNDATKAVETAARLKPFAITLDVMMPNKDGWHVLQDLKTSPATSEIPVVMCSILEEEEKGFALGATDYLVKPILQEELVHALNRINQNGQISEVLVIDDSLEDLRLVQKILEDHGKFRVFTAQGGTQGLAMIENRRPDAIILDLFMPDMNGFAVLEKLSLDLKLCNIPVLIVSGADLTPEHHKALADFGQQALTKGTFGEKDLLNYVETALKRYRPQEKDSPRK